MKTNMIVVIVVIGSVICCLCAVCISCGALILIVNQADSFDLELTPQIGNIAPDFQLESVDGETISLNQFQGKPVLVNFWAVWCGPCQEEMPIIQDRFRQHNPDLVVLAVEEGESRTDLLKYLEESEVTFFVLMGTDSVAQRYGIYAYPTSYFIDANGIIRSIVVGSMSQSDLDAELAKIGLED